jgi:hypothetical protein
MTILSQLEAELRASRRLWQYETHVAGKALSIDQMIAVAERVLASGKSWAEGFAAEFSARQYPPGYSDDGE